MNVIEHDSPSPRLLIDGGKKYPPVMPVLPAALHDHPFAEVHIITQGDALYIVDGITHAVSEGNAILIPAEKYHASPTLPQPAPSRARTLEAGKRWARLAQARAASRTGSALPRLGAELELRRSGSSLGPSQ